MTDEMRAEFEVAFRAKFGFGATDVAETKSEDGAVIMGAALWAWQASREAVVVDLPRVVGFEGAYDSHRHHEFVPSMSDVEDADEIFSLCRRIEAKEAIEAQGLKVKP
ncbi:hypothetical protein [Pseudomonas sp. KCJK9000]|uniref:hypothetical protein n=1 Tax=Pseudomonas sp. KCJK9000 TaxID=3344566 RepID=UPI00390667B3